MSAQHERVLVSSTCHFPVKGVRNILYSNHASPTSDVAVLSDLPCERWQPLLASFLLDSLPLASAAGAVETRRALCRRRPSCVYQMLHPVLPTVYYCEQLPRARPIASCVRTLLQACAFLSATCCPLRAAGDGQFIHALPLAGHRTSVGCCLA